MNYHMCVQGHDSAVEKRHIIMKPFVYIRFIEAEADFNSF